MSNRPSQRQNNEMREISVETGINDYAEGSCLISFGNTKVHCTASVQEMVPRWMKMQGKKGGWLTAEYGMLPRSTHDRIDREATKGKQSGRTLEISRLIGRSLRAVVDLEKLGGRTIWLDCDVIQADGGTRTASITGAFIALHLCIQKLMLEGKVKQNPIQEYVAAISCGVTNAGAVIDLDYIEDSNAVADSNFVMTESGGLVEIQSTAEDKAINETEFLEMMRLAKNGIADLIHMQKQATGQAS
ncbi:MAG: ribonuclease PH [Magnetococcales bacterium]|nr:ribonuclease PH [Magnetococcales bacterium]|tara:strand:+ start:30471 stop:31205 length:735 start_codon:yes stop_codon:yes gene_type:complete